MTPKYINPEFLNELDEEFAWVKFVGDMESLCAKMESELPPEKRVDVTVSMKYGDFKLFLRSARRAINKLYGVEGGLVQ